MFTRWFKTICLKQPSSYMDICVAPSLAKIPSFLNQESPIFWHWTCPAFSLSIQSPCGGSSHDTLLVGDKRNALFSCHSAKSSSEPGMQTSRGSLWTLSPHPSPYWATSREVTRLGKGRFHRIYRWTRHGHSLLQTALHSPPPGRPSSGGCASIEVQVRALSEARKTCVLLPGGARIPQGPV